MECKFITNGLAISYDQVLKPCCAWNYSADWSKDNQLSSNSLVTWHSKPSLVREKQLLDQDNWSTYCSTCKNIEDQSRMDSVRLGGNSAYADYSHSDITLEIRPGNVCNFACQTCWPEASSRVSQYHHQANLIDIKNINSKSIDNFDFLLPIADRVKDVVLLGGEPFYDKSCKKFLQWASDHLAANITMFTNGSGVDLEFLCNYKKKITLVFSLDAVGRPAEYIRYGTDWETVLSNYQKTRQLNNVEVRVNITSSVYNYYHLKELIELLSADWPGVVTFGIPKSKHFLESVVPLHLRSMLIDRLESADDTIWKSCIEKDQQHNASNAVNSIINNLKTLEWNTTHYQTFCSFVNSMDRVKNSYAQNYCEFMSELLDQKITQI